MRYFCVGAVLVALTSPAAIAQPAAASDRTVQYYTDNPYVRERVLQQCYNDPGHLRNNPDCVNAKKGDIADAAKQGAGTFFHGKVPSPEYFSWDHQGRSQVLASCRHMTPAQKAKYSPNCEDAEASIEADQRRATGSLPPVPAPR
jgi:hypothetical protein